MKAARSQWRSAGVTLAPLRRMNIMEQAVVLAAVVPGAPADVEREYPGQQARRGVQQQARERDEQRDVQGEDFVFLEREYQNGNEADKTIRIAARAWLAAAKQALSRSAATEAIHYIDAGLKSTSSLPDSPASKSLELALELLRVSAPCGR